jgi:hypothetical protein
VTTVGIHRDEDGGIILLEAGKGDGDGEYFRLWDKEW